MSERASERVSESLSLIGKRFFSWRRFQSRRSLASTRCIVCELLCCLELSKEGRKKKERRKPLLLCVTPAILN